MLKRNIVVLIVVVAVISVAVGYLLLTSKEETEVVEVTETAPLEMNDPNIKDTGEVWLDLIEGARSTIDIEAYYLGSASPPFILDNIYRAIIDAAENRGVKVRILVDESHVNDEMVRELENYENIEILAWHGDGVLHSKYMIVDEKVVSVGSANMSYYAMAIGGSGNREINLTLRGENIAETYTYIFETGWTSAGGESRDAKFCWDEDWLIPVADLGGVQQEEVISTIDAFAELFDMAKEKIYVYMYDYAGAPPKLENAIWNALDRGVSVEVLVDTDSEVNWPGALSELVGHGASVSVIDHPYAAHAKLIISDDDWAYVGSSNIHPTWMLEGREVGVLINSKNTVATLLGIFMTDWGSRYSRYV